MNLETGIMGHVQTPEQDAQERIDVIREAHTWLRTPYHHSGRIKGAGVDCLMLLCEVYEKCGIIDHVEPPEYSPEWHLHRSDELYMNGLQLFASETDSPKPGDVMLWRFGRCYSHAGIMINDYQIIHAYIGTPVSIAEFKNTPFRGRPVKYFTLWSS